ncbi:hypothetical protein PMAYCL1PPCAC_03197, partial [Pristionchus mayeri]
RMRLVECTARTSEDVRLYAEKAAFEAMTLQPFINSLEKRTIQMLSPETLLFAEAWYEKKLAECVVTALIECSKIDAGKSKAIEILNAPTTSHNIRKTWKPLVDSCSARLRSLKLDSTNARLSRLSELWSKCDYEAKQAQRLRTIVYEAIYTSIESALCSYQKLVEWIELYSIPTANQKLIHDVKDVDLPTQGRNTIVVNYSETFAAAETFLEGKMMSKSHVHVIVGNEDDAARFFIRIYDRFCDHGVHLNWRGKDYGDHGSNKIIRIVIGTIDWFSRRTDQSQGSAVFVHAERYFYELSDSTVETRSLDEFLAELFVLTAITTEHLCEIEDVVVRKCEMLPQLIRSWPNHYQIFEEANFMNLWDQHLDMGGNYKRKFIQLLREHVNIWIADRMKRFEMPTTLRDHIVFHANSFVHSAFVALAAAPRQDYIVFAERSSVALIRRIRLKQPLEGDFGLQQFLEMRHGCALSPYILKGEQKSAKLSELYDHMLVVQRYNPYSEANIPNFHAISRSCTSKGILPKQMNSVDFAVRMARWAKGYISNDDHTMIIVCCNNLLLTSTFNQIKYVCGDIVRICETPQGALTESRKNPSRSIIVCTSSVCFEGWKFIPHTRKYLNIIVGHHVSDTASLEVAYNLAPESHILGVVITDEEAFEKTTSRYGRSMKPIELGQLRSVPEMPIKSYQTSGDIHSLIDAKRLLHQSEQKVAVHAKMVHAMLPRGRPRLSAADSPTDVACQGFLDMARRKMEETSKLRKQVENLLSIHSKTDSQTMLLNTDVLQNISNRYLIDKDRLKAYVEYYQRPVSWEEVRLVMSRFTLPQDALLHWITCFGQSSVRLFALSEECASPSNPLLLNMRFIQLPDDYRQHILQCSDRHLEDYRMYQALQKLNETELLNMEGASEEHIYIMQRTDSFISNLAANSTEFHSNNDQPASIQLLYRVMLKSADRQCPLYLFPRRCNERLTRDLFDSGLVISTNYNEIEQHMHQYDTIRLSVINETDHLSARERLLTAESALMEYGSLEWMEWLARRTEYFDYDPEVARFYHKSVATLDYCVQDESLIQRLDTALAEKSASPVSTPADKLRMDSFVYNTMDVLQRGERLVLIDPPFRSNEALGQLTLFIRSRRMPPTISDDFNEITSV